MDGQERLTMLLAAMIVIAFFLPWISVEAKTVGDISGFLTGKRQDVIDSISGFSVPLLANSEESRFMISVIKIFNPQIRDADKKSYLLWCVPLIAVLIALAGKVFRRAKIIRLFLGIVSIAIVCAVTYKLLSTDLDKFVLKVNIVYGLWMTLFGFFTIGALEIASFLALQKTPPLKDPKSPCDQTQLRPQEAPRARSAKGTFLKITGTLLILFTVSADWLKWGFVSGFSQKQIQLILLGCIIALYGYIISKNRPAK